MITVHRVREQFAGTLLFLILAIFLFSGCASQVGDDCTTDNDCPQGTLCDRSVEDGFCTLRNCRPGGCPSESICVAFDRHQTYCMRSCSADEDCRRGHVCRFDEEKEVSYCFTDD